MASIRGRVLEFLLGIVMRPNLHPRLQVRGLRRIDAHWPLPFPGRSHWTATEIGGVQTWSHATRGTDPGRPPIVFLTDCRLLADRLQQRGEGHAFHEEPGAFHVYASVFPFTPESVRSIDRAARFID